jgi:hypothetical protein
MRREEAHRREIHERRLRQVDFESHRSNIGLTPSSAS